MMNKRILNLAIPSIISNITVPLLGLVDVTIVGHLGSASYIGAIAVGGMLFNMLYWSFGFLRMGTSGMTAQAYGRGDRTKITRLLVRALGIGTAIGILFILVSPGIQWGAFRLIDATPEVEMYARTYFHICIWGAPAVLCLYGFTGWFVGMQNSRVPMMVAILQNLINIVVSVCLVFCFGMKVEGVAYGTLVAQYSGVALALFWWNRYFGTYRKGVSLTGSFRLRDMRTFFIVNKDIFLRTLCLMAVTIFFTSTGARQGDVILAVNTLLMQLFTMFSYIMDGFAYAGEALAGRYIGAADPNSLKRLIRLLFRWGIGFALLFTVLYGAGGEMFLRLLTNDSQVIAAAGSYFYWVLTIPIAGFSAFLWDGIYIGATQTRWMFRSMLTASAGFFLTYYLLHPAMGNHALWAAFILYLSLRGVILQLLSKSALREALL